MEKKRKKLSLKKETITSLSGNEQRHLYGGNPVADYNTRICDTIIVGCTGGCAGSDANTCNNNTCIPCTNSCPTGNDTVNVCYSENICESMPPHCTVKICPL